MNVREWLTATNPHAKGLNEEQKVARRDLRSRVLQTAGTSYPTIINALHRGRIGPGLLARLEAATAQEGDKITAADGLGEVPRTAT